MKTIKISLIAAAAMTLFGCDGDSNSSNNFSVPTAQLRVTHASADAPKVSILMDGAIVSGLDKVDYSQGSGLLSVDSGDHDLIVRAF